MKKHWKAIAVVVAVFALLAWVLISALNERASMTAAASGVVTKVEFDRDEESSSLDETDISYVFDAEGRKVEALRSLPGDKVKDYPVGRSISVCYKPGEPATSRINATGQACGG